MNHYYHFIHSSSDIAEFYELVKAIYIDEKHYSIEAPDKFTETARHYAVKKNGKIIAGFRINIKEPNAELPLGNAHEIPCDSTSKLAEISRWCIHPQYRTKISMQKTFADFAKYGKELAITHFLANVTLELVDFYARFGLHKLGEPYYNPAPFAFKPEYLNHKPNFQILIAATDDWYKRYVL